MFLMMFITSTFYFTFHFCTRIIFFFFGFFLWENEPDRWEKLILVFIFLENAAERCWKSGKKYVERDCCAVNSCHLYVLICVYLFFGFVSIVELAVIFCLNWIWFQWSNYSCHINCCWFLKLLSKVLGNIGLIYIQSVSRLCSLVGVLHNSIETPWNI